MFVFEKNPFLTIGGNPSLFPRICGTNEFDIAAYYKNI